MSKLISGNGFGTQSYTAPEIFENDNSYTNKIDIWSAGCVIYEITKLKKLFPQTTSYKLINSIVHFDIDKHLLNENTDYILMQCLKSN